MVAQEPETANRDGEKGAEDRLQSACEKAERKGEHLNGA
jgi:hypothetical protein